MPTTRDALLEFLDGLLTPDRFHDYCPNGLQVEGSNSIARLATGVTASQALIEQAVDWGADAILVHHGYFWRGEAEPVVGMKRRRLARLLVSDTSLFAYHLPLDAHPLLGNNAQLGQLLGLSIDSHRPLHPGAETGVGTVASLPAPEPVSSLLARVAELTARTPLHIGEPGDSVTKIAWCTGAAQGYIDAAIASGADVFITGEASEQTVHIAREERIHFIAAGHHATERYGVQAVGNHVSENLGVQHRFFDIDNPV